MVKVKKRTGRLEGYKKSKLIKSLKKAGASARDATAIEKKVYRKVKRASITSVATIRKYALRLLKPLNLKAYKKYIAFRKRKKRKKR